MNRDKAPPILGDPYLAQMIRNLREADVALKAHEWVQGKSAEQIRAHIELMRKQHRVTGEAPALMFANDLQDLLDLKLKAAAAAERGAT